MNTKNRCTCTWAAPLMAAALLVLAACDQEWPGVKPDVAIDLYTDLTDSTPWDTLDDTAVDTAVDTVTDTGVDLPPDTGPCTYPTGTYAFNAVGDMPGPAHWPGSIKGATETSALEHADLNAFYCDPSVQSILVFLATLS